MGYNVPTLDEIIAALQKRIRAMEVIIFSNVGTVVVTTPLDIPSLSASVTYYTDPNSRLPRADVTWTWQAPAAPDPDALDADPAVDYMFGYQLSTDANAPVVFSSTKGALTANVKNLPVDISVVGKVYAVSQRGATGPIKQVVTAISHDTTPPPQTSTPVVTAGLKSVTVTYDGKDVSNNAMPLDYSMVRVYKGSVDNFDVATQGILVDTIVGAGSLYIPANDNYDRIYVRLVPLDFSGNVGVVPSTTAFADPKRTTVTELGIVLPGGTAFSDFGNLILDGSFESSIIRNLRTAMKHTAYTFDNTAGLPHHGAYTVKLVSTDTTAKIFNITDQTVSETSQLSEITVTPLMKLYVAFRVRNMGANGSVVLYARIRLNNDTFTNLTYPAVAANLTTGDWEVIEGIIEMPANAKSLALWLYNNTTTTGAWYFDSFQLRQIISTQLIEDAAITRAKIANLAVGNGQIENLDAGKIDTGYLHSDRIDSDTIQTRHIAIGAVTSTELADNVGVSLDIINNPALDDMASAATLAAVSNVANAASTDVNKLKSAVTVIDGSGITISQPGSPFQLTIDNDSLDFWEGGARVAYVNGQKLYIKSAEILQQLMVGVHVIEKYDANNTFIRWVG